MLRPDLRKDTRDLEEQQAEFLASQKAPAARAERIAQPQPPQERRSVQFAEGTKAAAPSEPIRAAAPAPRVVGSVIERETVAWQPAHIIASLSTLTDSVARTGFPDVVDVDLSGIATNKTNSSSSTKTSKRKPSLFAKFLQSKNVGSATSEASAPLIAQDETRISGSMRELTSNVRFGAADDSIHADNVNRIAAMSVEEREEATQAIFAKFDPDLLSGLLQRAKLQESTENTGMSNKAKQTVTEEEEQQQQRQQQQVTAKNTSSSNDSEAKGVAQGSDLSWIQSPQDLESAARQLLPASEKQKLRWMQPTIFAEEDASPSSSADSDPNADPFEALAVTVNGLPPRFSLTGNLIAVNISGSNEETSTDTKLFHHGEEPDRAGYTIDELSQLMRSTVAGQRSLALRALEGLFRTRQECLWLTKERHAQSVLPEELPLLLRCALDDTTPSVLSCAVGTLYEYLVPTEHERQRGVLAELDTCQTSQWAPVARAQGAYDFYGRAADFGSSGAGMGGGEEEKEEDEDAGDSRGPNEGVIRERPVDKEEEEEATDTDRVLVSPVRGMVHTGLLQRLSFLLGCEEDVVHATRGSSALTPLATTKCLGILLHIARHSNWAANKIVQHPRLIRGIIKRFVLQATEGWMKPGDVVNKADEQQDTRERAAGLLHTALVIEMLNALAMHRRSHVMQLNRGGVLNATRRYIGLACDAFEISPNSDGGGGKEQGSSEDVIKPVMCRVLRAVLGLWSTSLSYGIDATDFLSFLPLLQRISEHFPSVQVHVHLVLTRFMRYCLDDLRDTDETADDGSAAPDSFAVAAADITTEIGERLAHAVTVLVLEDTPISTSSSEKGVGVVSWTREASALRVAESFGRLLMGPQALALSGLENTLSTHSNTELLASSQNNHIELSSVVLGATAAGVRRSVGMALAQVATKICQAASRTRVAQAIEALQGWPLQNRQEKMNDPMHAAEWLLALVKALDMCMSAGVNYGLVLKSEKDPLQMQDMLRASSLIDSVLPCLLERMVDSSRAETANTKVPLEPNHAVRLRTGLLLMSGIAELLVRVRESIAVTSDSGSGQQLGSDTESTTSSTLTSTSAARTNVGSEAQARRRLILELVRRGGVYVGDEWVWRNLLGALLTPGVLGMGSNPNMSKAIGQLLTHSGRPELVYIFTNVFGGDIAIAESFARHHNRASRVRTLAIGRPIENLNAMSEAGGAWPVLSLRMVSDPKIKLSSSDKQQQQQVVWLSLNLAHALQDDLPPPQLLVLVLRMLTNADVEWVSEPRVATLVVGLVYACTASFSSSSSPSPLNSCNLYTQLVNVVGGAPALGALAAQLVQTFVDSSFGNRATSAGVLVFLRADFATTMVYQEVLSEVCSSSLLHVLGGEEQNQALPQDDTYFTTREDVSEQAARTWGSVLARGFVSRERGAFGYWMAVHHVAVVGTSGFLGGKLLREIKVAQPTAAEDVEWYDRTVVKGAGVGDSYCKLLKKGLGVCG